MTIYGLIFRLFGWAIGLGLITQSTTMYTDGHTDGTMVALGVVILVVWVATVASAVRRAVR
jgi:hypothetical protein